MSSPKAHVAVWKKDAVSSLVKQFEKYPLVGLLNMENLPSAQLAQMKSKLRGSVEIVMTRRSLITRAIESAKKPGMDAFAEYMKTGMPALLFTKENPFALFKTLKKSKSKAAAKPGQTAPYDLVIPAGPTPFSPGPVISEFAQIGVKAGVDAGKVAVKQEAVVAKAGEPIKPLVASMLTRLGIEPMEIGLNLVAVYEAGTVFPAKLLDIDEEAFMASLLGAVRDAHGLALEVAYLSNDTIEPLLARAWSQAKSLSLEASIPVPELIGDVLAKAELVASGLKEDMHL